MNIVDRIDFQADDSVHTMAYVYETIMKEMRDAAGDAGEFYTPRPVIRFMVEQSFLKLEESMCAGTQPAEQEGSSSQPSSN